MSGLRILVALVTVASYSGIVVGVFWMLHTHARNTGDYGVFIAPSIAVVLFTVLVAWELRGYFRRGGS